MMGCLLSKHSNGDTQENQIHHKDSENNSGEDMETRSTNKRSSVGGEGSAPSKKTKPSKQSSSTQSSINPNQGQSGKQKANKKSKKEKKNDKRVIQNSKKTGSKDQPGELTDITVELKNKGQPMQTDPSNSKLSKSAEKYAKDDDMADDTKRGIENANLSISAAEIMKPADGETKQQTDQEITARENDVKTKEQKSSESEIKQETDKQVKAEGNDADTKEENSAKCEIKNQENAGKENAKSMEGEMKEQKDKRQKAEEKKKNKELKKLNEEKEKSEQENARKKEKELKKSKDEEENARKKDKEFKKLKEEKEKLEQENAGLQKEMKNLEADVKSAQKNLSKADNRLEAQKNRNMQELSKMDHELSKLKANIVIVNEEKESLLTRLSALAGARLLDNNPNIADLSDKNRPTKLGEQYSELYDNEWTDAFTELKDDGVTDDVQCITVLLTMLITTYKTCEEKAKSQNDGLIQSVAEFLKDEKLPPEMSKHFKETRKKNYANYLPELKQVLVSKLASIEDVTEKRLRSTESFYTKCLEICWLMCIQDPPMYIDCRTKLRGEKYYKGQYKEYTQSGPIIDYVVWPPIYLQKNGPILCKGTVQCTSSKDDINVTQQKPAGSQVTVLNVNASKSVPLNTTPMSLSNATLTKDKEGKRSKSAYFSKDTHLKKGDGEQKLSTVSKRRSLGEQTPAKTEPDDSSSHL